MKRNTIILATGAVLFAAATVAAWLRVLYFQELARADSLLDMYLRFGTGQRLVFVDAAIALAIFVLAYTHGQKVTLIVGGAFSALTILVGTLGIHYTRITEIRTGTTNRMVSGPSWGGAYFALAAGLALAALTLAACALSRRRGSPTAVADTF